MANEWVLGKINRLLDEAEAPIAEHSPPTAPLCQPDRLQNNNAMALTDLRLSIKVDSHFLEGVYSASTRIASA